MMKQDQQNSVPAKKKGTENYNLHSHAVDDLVDSHTGRTKAYSEKELRKFRTRKGIVLPEWLKILLLKAWFAGVVCYFIIWGLGIYLSATLDLLVVAGIALGLVNDLLLNSLLRFMEETPGENSKWMLFPWKHYVTLPLNIVYSTLVLLCVYSFYTHTNALLASLSGSANTVSIGVEPILFGILYMAFDMLFIGIKQMFIRIYHDAVKKVSSQSKH